MRCQCSFFFHCGFLQDLCNMRPRLDGSDLFHLCLVLALFLWQGHHLSSAQVPGYLGCYFLGKSVIGITWLIDGAIESFWAKSFVEFGGLDCLLHIQGFINTLGEPKVQEEAAVKAWEEKSTISTAIPQRLSQDGSGKIKTRSRSLIQQKKEGRFREITQKSKRMLPL